MKDIHKHTLRSKSYLLAETRNLPSSSCISLKVEKEVSYKIPCFHLSTSILKDV